MGIESNLNLNQNMEGIFSRRRLLYVAGGLIVGGIGLFGLNEMAKVYEENNAQKDLKNFYSKYDKKTYEDFIELLKKNGKDISEDDSSKIKVIFKHGQEKVFRWNIPKKNFIYSFYDSPNGNLFLERIPSDSIKDENEFEYRRERYRTEKSTIMKSLGDWITLGFFSEKLYYAPWLPKDRDKVTISDRQMVNFIYETWSKEDCERSYNEYKMFRRGRINK